MTLPPKIGIIRSYKDIKKIYGIKPHQNNGYSAMKATTIEIADIELCLGTQEELGRLQSLQFKNGDGKLQKGLDGVSIATTGSQGGSKRDHKIKITITIAEKQIPVSIYFSYIPKGRDRDHTVKKHTEEVRNAIKQFDKLFGDSKERYFANIADLEERIEKQGIFKIKIHKSTPEDKASYGKESEVPKATQRNRSTSTKNARAEKSSAKAEEAARAAAARTAAQSDRMESKEEKPQDFIPAPRQTLKLKDRSLEEDRLASLKGIAFSDEIIEVLSEMNPTLLTQISKKGGYTAETLTNAHKRMEKLREFTTNLDPKQFAFYIANTLDTVEYSIASAEDTLAFAESNPETLLQLMNAIQPRKKSRKKGSGNPKKKGRAKGRAKGKANGKGTGLVALHKLIAKPPENIDSIFIEYIRILGNPQKHSAYTTQEQLNTLKTAKDFDEAQPQDLTLAGIQSIIKNAEGKVRSKEKELMGNIKQADDLISSMIALLGPYCLTSEILAKYITSNPTMASVNPLKKQTYQKLQARNNTKKAEIIEFMCRAAWKNTTVISQPNIILIRELATILQQKLEKQYQADKRANIERSIAISTISEQIGRSVIENALKRSIARSKTISTISKQIGRSVIENALKRSIARSKTISTISKQIGRSVIENALKRNQAATVIQKVVRGLRPRRTFREQLRTNREQLRTKRYDIVSGLIVYFVDLRKGRGSLLTLRTKEYDRTRFDADEKTLNRYLEKGKIDTSLVQLAKSIAQRHNPAAAAPKTHGQTCREEESQKQYLTAAIRLVDC